VILATHNYWPDADSTPGIRGVIKRALVGKIAREVDRTVRASNADAVLTSTSVAKRLAESPARVTSWGDVHTDTANRADNATLHDFADALKAISLAAPDSFGLAHRRIAFCDVNEMRWLDLLLNERLFYAQVVDERLQRQPAAALVTLTRRSRIERIAMEVGRSRGRSVSVRARLSWANLALLGQERPVFDELRLMTDRDLAYVQSAEAPSFRPASKPRVLFIGRLNRTVERLRAALPAFARRGDCELFLLYSWRVTGVERFVEAGVPTSFMYSWISYPEAQSLMQRVRAVAPRGWEHVRSQADAKLTHSFHGSRVFEVAADMLRAMSLHGAARAALFVEIASRVIDRLKPSVIVSFEDWEVNRAFSRIAERAGIPTLAYYALSPANFQNLVRRSQKWLAVAGEAMPVSYSSGVHDWGGRVRVVGDTLIDRLTTETRAQARVRVCATHGLDPARPILLLLSTWVAFPLELWEVRELFQRTCHAARQIPGLQVVVKAHPLQPIEMVKQWMREWDCEGLAVRDVDLFELARASDVVSTPSTSALWQCLMAGTPAICVQPRKNVEQFESLGYEYLAGRGVVFIPEGEPVVPVLKRLLFDARARAEQIQKGYDHARDHVGPADGRSGERLAVFVSDILASTKPESVTASVPATQVG
jgi:hypothetical protein